MNAFIIIHLTVTDPEKFQAYLQAVPETLQPFDGGVLAKGMVSKVFSGDHDKKVVGILKFPSLEKANDWYQSAAYQKLVPIRDQAAEVAAISYEVLE